jgi:hypothetical protein
VLVRSVKVCCRGNGWAGWGWGAGRHCDDSTVFSSDNVDLELQAQVEDSLTPEQRLVDGVLRRAGERRRKVRKVARTGNGFGKRRGREKVEWGNREDGAGADLGGKRKVVFWKAGWSVE